jgi:hypothetical protein
VSEARLGPNDGCAASPPEIESLLTEYLLALDAKQVPQLQDFLARLRSVADREMFIDLVDQVAFADQRLPLRLRAHVVLGGRYELVELIGSGGMGRVWRAVDRKLQCEVAVKVLSLAAAAAFDVDRMVDREGRLLARLSHPNIVRVLDTGSDGEHRYLVMELVGGRALDELIARFAELAPQRELCGKDLLDLVGPAAAGRPPVIEPSHDWPTAAARVLVELLRTLEAAHGVGVVHRDLKPANVRVLGGGVPVLLDFGIGFVGGGSPGTLTASMFGTAQYSAPEQWDAERQIDARTDVYQMGLVGYELLTLRRCFAHENSMQLMRAIRDQTYASPRELRPSIPGRLEACVLHAMEGDPARRYQAAAAFREDLERWLAGGIPDAAKPLAGVGWRVRQFARRHRSGLILAAAVLAAAAAGFALSRGTEGVAVERLGGRVVRFDRNVFVAGLFIVERNGQRWFEPAEFEDQDRFGLIECRGGVEVDLRVAHVPEGDAKLAIYACAVGDEVGRGDLRILGQQLQAAGRQLERQGGEPLPPHVMQPLLSSGKGALQHQLPVDKILAREEWYARGVTCIVL